jgi:endonuclease/exonuclease/phosphatase family metal-dependent hydrolase
VTTELVSGVSIDDFVTAARPFRTEAEFRASPFFARHGAPLEALLLTPRPVGGPAPAGGATVAAPGFAAPPAAVPPSADRDGAPLRVVHWNIEKGKAFEALLERLGGDPDLANADAWCLNEVDDGMNRSGNRDVAAELARHLGASGFYLPNYIEATKGLADERRIPGENARGLHGVAILTRRPVRDVRVVPLPNAWDYFDYAERRFGGRRALFVTIDAGSGPVEIGTAHLEMRAPPAGRARQMDALLRGIVNEGAPVLLSGDWNTHTFPRGARGDTLRGFLRIVGTAPGRLERELLDPAAREPLFRQLESHGFRVAGFNDEAPTAWQDLGRVEDLSMLPGPAARLVLSLFRLEGRRLPLRLDWFAGRGLEALSARTPSSMTTAGVRASDHEPIVVTVRRTTHGPR